MKNEMSVAFLHGALGYRMQVPLYYRCTKESNGIDYHASLKADHPLIYVEVFRRLVTNVL